MRLVSKGTIEENILSMAQEKLQLEREVSSNEGQLFKHTLSLLFSSLWMDLRLSLFFSFFYRK